MEEIRAKRLARGDTLALVSPASNVWEDSEIRHAREIISSLGFSIREGRHLFRRHGYLAGTDTQRADDLNAVFADPNVSGIICLRGGYGSMRILPRLDYTLIRENPKVLIGYSDITALLNAIWARTGLITFHGPNANEPFTGYTYDAFRNLLITPTEMMPLATQPPHQPAPGSPHSIYRVEALQPGSARGPLIGGNISIIDRLIGTPYAPDFRGALLVLEDINESPRRIDAMLTHMWLAGAFEELAGVVFGQAVDCVPDSRHCLSIEEILLDRFGPLNIPVVRGFPIGHIPDKATLPIGAVAELDANAGTLTLLKPAVL